MSATSFDLNKIKSYDTVNPSGNTLDQAELTNMFVNFGLTRSESIRLADYLKKMNNNTDLTAEKVLEFLDDNGNDDNKLDTIEVKIASQMAKENKANVLNGNTITHADGKAHFKGTQALFTTDGTIDSTKLGTELGKIVNADGTLKPDTADTAQAKKHIRLALVATGLSEAEANQIIILLANTATSKEDRKAFVTALVEATKATTGENETAGLRNTVGPKAGQTGMPELKTATNGNYKYYENADVKKKISTGNKVNKEGLMAFLNGANIPDPSNGGKAFTAESGLLHYLSNLTPDQAMSFLNNMGAKNDNITPEDARLGIELAYRSSIMHKNRTENPTTKGTYNLRADDIRDFLSTNNSTGNVSADVMKEKLIMLFAEMGLEVPEAKLTELAGKPLEEILKILNGGTALSTDDHYRLDTEKVKTATGATPKTAIGDGTPSPTAGKYSLDSIMSLADFAAAIKADSGNTIDKAKLAALLLDMDIAKDQTTATALADLLVKTQNVTTPEELANRLDSGSSEINSMSIMLRMFANQTRGTEQDINKTEFLAMLPSLSDDAREKIIQIFIPSYTGTNINNNDLADIFFGTENSTSLNKMLPNTDAYNKTHAWTKDEFTNFLGNSTGTKLEDKLAILMRGFGIVPNLEEGRVLAQKMLENYRQTHNGKEPSPTELYDFINSNNTTTTTFDAKEFTQAIYTNGQADPKQFNASTLTWLLDRSTATQRNDILTDILVTQGGQTTTQANAIIAKLTALNANNLIANTLLGGAETEALPIVDKNKLISNIAAFKTANNIQ